MRHSRLGSKLAYIISLFALALIFSMSFWKTAADQTITNQPASEGRTITPAGSLLLDVNTRQPAVGALPVGFVRSPDTQGTDKLGRYLIAINSGYGIQFNAGSNRAQQSLSVIDLNARPVPAVVQDIYFPTPQSANVGAVFAPQAEADGSYMLYVSGGGENKIWIFRLRAGERFPVSPPSQGPNTKVEAPSIDIASFAAQPGSLRYLNNNAPVYPTGLAISSDGETLYVANNLDDSLGVISHLRSKPQLSRIELRRTNRTQFIYPYGVAALHARDAKAATKVYVSCWGDDSIAVFDQGKRERISTFIEVARHPTAMIFNASQTRLYVVNSNADSVSVIDTAIDRETERISVKLSETALIGSSPEGLALSADGATLYVANAHSNAVAVVALSAQARDVRSLPAGVQQTRSRVRGFIPTGQYPSAVAVAAHAIFVGNGKGTGFENSSVVVNNSGRAPNLPNDRFPVGTGRAGGMGGEYSVTLIAGNISVITEPEERTLAGYTRQVMRNDGLLTEPHTKLFRGHAPFKHVIYIIKENRTYDELYGDLEHAGNGERADGDPSLAIFGAGDAARVANGPAQNVTPNQHALSLRFGLLDRFFTNAEASPDGHNWSTAAFSTDYVDKVYRWNYGGRSRSYDFEGFNRLPNYYPTKNAPPLFPQPVGTQEIANFMRRYVPYLNNARDIAEPETLYLWDAAARAGLSYRNYGEFIGTLSQADVAAVNNNKSKSYPDTTETATAFSTKKSLEGHFAPAYRNFDLLTPDSMTVDSYRAMKETNGRNDPIISALNSDERFRGYSRLSEWTKEFKDIVADRAKAGGADRLPNLSIIRLPNDHTQGLAANMPTPQFYVADNDYALGKIVETVSESPYWRDTAIFVVEDDAQDGPDHVDAHRSPALVISAYNRPGAYIHTFHNTVSMIRTIEVLLGMQPMNQLDASASPIDIFRDEADLRPFKATLPEIALDNLITKKPDSGEAAYWMRRTSEQDMTHADMADARALNEIIWFSVRGAKRPLPAPARLPAYDAMFTGTAREAEAEQRAQTARNKERHQYQKFDPDDGN